MTSRIIRLAAVGAIALTSLMFTQSTMAQDAPQSRPAGRGRGGAQRPQIVSLEVSADRKITFRLAAPKAEAVRISSPDVPGLGKGEMTKGANDTWELTVGPVPAGAYRYTFSVDGIATADPHNYATSESNTNVWSLAVVPGSDVIDVKDVPHGAVAAITYQSKALNAVRRMHIYTPPGYENGTEKYPVFYLLHGSGDSDDAWTSEGRANFIIDNLIEQKKAVPMIVVMPAGHTSHSMGGGGRGGARGSDPFGEDFMGDIKPYVESHYRTINDRGHRAIAGLSMGGGQTLGIAFSHLDDFSYVGVFSSGAGVGGPGGSWEENHKADLDNADLKAGLKVLWLSTGAQDGLMPRTKATVELLKKHGFNPVFKDSEGAHTWLNWRDYLQEFAPQLFQK
jgi:enterochelin esterase-like enzyme